MTILFESGFEGACDTFESFDNVAVSGNGFYAAQRRIVHSGEQAAKLTIRPALLGDTDPGVRLVYFGEQHTYPADPKNLPDEAYYAAWYCLPAVASEWINIMQWKQARQTSDTTQTRDPVAFIKVAGTHPRNQCEFHLSLQYRIGSDGQYAPGSNELARSEAFVPVDEWFEVTAFLRWDKGQHGRIATWLNGQLLWDVQGLQTEYDQPYLSYPREVTWNNYASDVRPSPYSLYVDDVKVWTESGEQP